MGIYPNHGVEYCIVFRDGFDMTALESVTPPPLRVDGTSWIIPSCLTDARLTQSVYYASARNEWFGPRTFAQEWREPIVNQTVDIELTPTERDLIRCIEREHGDNILFQGWYDVNYM